MDDGRNQYRYSERESCEGLLGLIPHTLRGSLWNYEMRLTITHRFPSCTACSIPIINEYRKRGFDFILDACNEPNYLERIAGLEDLLKRPNLDEVRKNNVFILNITRNIFRVFNFDYLNF